MSSQDPDAACLQLGWRLSEANVCLASGKYQQRLFAAAHSRSNVRVDVKEKPTRIFLVNDTENNKVVCRCSYEFDYASCFCRSCFQILFCKPFVTDSWTNLCGRSKARAFQKTTSVVYVTVRSAPVFQATLPRFVLLPKCDPPPVPVASQSGPDVQQP